MWGSHLDGVFLGQETDADITAATAVPTETPEGNTAVSVPSTEPLILGLTRQQWLTLAAIAAVAVVLYKASQARRGD